MQIDPAKLRLALENAPEQSSDFDLNPGLKGVPGRVLRPAAVLIGLWESQRGARLILTKRASHLQHHPGQIAFPGGKVDQQDADPEATALREAQEEIGLPSDLVQILGRLPKHETVTGFSITPILGHIRTHFDANPQLGEVEEVFSVPLGHVLDASNYKVERRLWRGEWRYFYAVPYGPYYIWGATARILRGLAERIKG
jgi:8-oxo-dGTP pyrophosphatase MutT (NUDIX family)